MTAAEAEAWVGRTETFDDVATRQPMVGLAALLDHEQPPWQEGLVPPLGHWLYFHPRTKQSRIGADGHPLRDADSLLPPLDLPRRMWAGSRTCFLAPIPFGEPLRKRSVVTSVANKTGASGDMIFVTVHHEISAGGRLAVTEEQDIVYREAARPAAGPPPPAPATDPIPAMHVRTLVADPVQLFRYSALTFNGHRIHYDRDYARLVEYYPGLVVQGPYLATLLLDHLLRMQPGLAITSFDFRALRPIFDGSEFDLCSAAPEDGNIALWARDAGGAVAMTASAHWVEDQALIGKSR